MKLEPIQIEFRLGGKKAFLMGSPAGSSSSSMQCRAMQFIVARWTTKPCQVSKECEEPRSKDK